MAINANNNDLSLGFNAGPTSAPAPSSSHPHHHHHHHSMWPTSAPPPRYGLPPELGMFVVAPATPFHNHNHNHNHQDPNNNNNHNNSLLSSDPNHQINVGVIPLLTSSLDESPDLLPSRPRGAPIQFWNQHHQQQQNQPYYNKTGSISFDQNAVTLLNSGGGDGGGGAGAVVSGGATPTCQDCGNQAKKDCSHRRCRTCCRSRGFDCTTHVRSTWVPAARRRERQMMGVAAGCGGGGGGGASSGSTSGAKKPRLIASQNTATTSHTSNSNTPPRSFDTSSSHQDVGFKESLPRQVRAPAVFKCVRVTAVDDGDDEYAYQAVVRIGGHLFKGFLYDQGAEAGDGFPNISELHLGGGRNGVSSSSPILDQPEAYGGSGGGVLGGSGYGNTIN